MHLLAILQDGSVPGYDGERPALVSEVLQHTVALYSRAGFAMPWISYLAVEGSEAVGACSFKSQPVNSRVEIAYFTFAQHEGRGIATAMASELVAMALSWPDPPCVTAQTLPERNASHRILEKLGFEAIGTVEHPEDGTVLEWQLVNRASA